MKYIDQSLQDIRLYLVSGDPQLQQFQVLKEASCQWGEYTVSYGILGASHFVTISGDFKRITEICACVEGSFAAPTRIEHEERLYRLQGEAHKALSPVDYAISYFARPLTELNVTREEMARGSDHIMSYTFPASDPTSIDPVTILTLNIQPTYLQITSIHTYPNEDRLLETRSGFRLL